MDVGLRRGRVALCPAGLEADTDGGTPDPNTFRSEKARAEAALGATDSIGGTAAWSPPPSSSAPAS